MSPVIGDPSAFAMSDRPSSRMPVPASSSTSAPVGVRTSTDGVFPPYRTVDGPGLGIDPRVPQNLRRKDIEIRDSGLGTRDWEKLRDASREARGIPWDVSSP